MSKRVELLSPAGNMEGFYGALNAGCDAVYLGGPAYGARAYADNFSMDELAGVIRTAKLHQVKVYLTVNILTRQDELAGCVRMVKTLYDQGLDGVIVQDLGVLYSLRKACPSLALHASTQLSGTLPESARFLKRLGVSRIVPARELSLAEIKAIRQEGIEVESFIHGAMCYCYSGRCLLSSFLGGRSGNRGRCAGPCRLPYQILDEQQRPVSFPPFSNAGRRVTADAASTGNSRRSRQASPAFDGQPRETYPISMRDMCALEILPDLIDAGIDSFKIEGRMKKPEYAAGVTAFYRKYIDRFYAWDAAGRREPWSIDPQDKRDLESLYLRAALSTGYYKERNGVDMISLSQPGYAGSDDALLEKIHDQYVAPRPQLPVSGRAVVLTGQMAELTVTCSPCGSGRSPAVSVLRASHDKGRSGDDPAQKTKHAVSVRVTSPQPVQLAQNRPLTTEDIRRNLTKTGDTDFYFDKLEIVTDGKSFVPVSVLNQLRRAALQDLAGKLAQQESEQEIPGQLADQESRQIISGTPDRTQNEKAISGTPGQAQNGQTISETPGQAQNGKNFSGQSGSLLKEESRSDGANQQQDNHEKIRHLFVQVQTEEQLAAVTAILAKPLPRQNIFVTNAAQNPSDTRKNQERSKDNLPGNISQIRTDQAIILDGALAEAFAADPAIVAQLPVENVYLAFPYIFRESDRREMDRLFDAAKRYQKTSRGHREENPAVSEKKIAGFLCRTLEEIEFLREKDYDGRVIADASVYRWNQAADQVLSSWYDMAVMPLELSGKELRQTFHASMDKQILQAYGYLPMMVTANCVRLTSGHCLRRQRRDTLREDARRAKEYRAAQKAAGSSPHMPSQQGFWYLRDRKEALLPVCCDCRHCTNIIYNSVPLSLHQQMHDPVFGETGGILLAFTVENRQETGKVLSCYLDLLRAGASFGKEKKNMISSYTTGHFRKGAI